MIEFFKTHQRLRPKDRITHVRMKRTSVRVLSQEIEQKESNGYVIFSPGWAESIYSYAHVLSQLADDYMIAGEIFEPPRWGARLRLLHDGRYENERSAQALRTVITHKAQGRKFSIVSSSRGSIAAVRIANEMPEDIEHLVMLNPAGFLPEMSFTELSHRFAQETSRTYTESTDDDHRKRIRRVLARSAVVFVALNPHRAYHEAKCTTGVDLSPDLFQLLQKRVQVTIVQGADDSVYPPSEVQNSILSRFERLEEVDGSSVAPPKFIVVKGGHNLLTINSKEFTPLIASILMKRAA